MNSQLEELIRYYQQDQLNRKSYSGFRIQITSGTDRNLIYETKAAFYKTLPNLQTTVVYQAPNFKLRAGTYPNRSAATRDLMIVKTFFPEAFIIRDDIPIEP